jgi:hypothetical protein
MEVELVTDLTKITVDHELCSIVIPNHFLKHPFLKRVATLETPNDPITKESLIRFFLLPPRGNASGGVGFAVRAGVTRRIRASHATVLMRMNVIDQPHRIVEGLRAFIAVTDTRLLDDGQDARASALRSWRWGRLVLQMP